MQSGNRRRERLFHKHKLCCSVLFAALWFSFLPTLLNAEPEKPTEYDVKAAYLYNFGKFVRWPEGTVQAGKDSFSICIFGRDPFGKILDSTLEGATWEGKPVTARRIANSADASTCNVLFLASSNADQWGQLLPAIEKLPILTVSDAPTFARRGGMIEFLLSESRIRFEVNLVAADKSGLTLSSQLLKVAIRVRKGDER